MELVAVALSIVSLIVSLSVALTVRRPIHVDIHVPQLPVQSLEVTLEEPTRHPDPLPPPADDQIHCAWKNEKNIPSFQGQSMAPGRPAPTTGPLQRPYGFPG